MKGTFREQLGLRIKELRLNKHMSQRQLGEKLGVGNSTISSIEAGKRNMTIETLESIAEALEVDVLNLITLKEDFYIPDIIQETAENYKSISNMYIKIFSICYEQGLRYKNKEDYYYLFLFMQSIFR